MADRPSRAARTRLRTERDLARLHKARDRGQFWRALAVLGSVGWPIIGLSVSGALLGRCLDTQLLTEHRWTLALLLLGTLVGCVMAYRSLRGEP